MVSSVLLYCVAAGILIATAIAARIAMHSSALTLSTKLAAPPLERLSNSRSKSRSIESSPSAENAATEPQRR